MSTLIQRTICPFSFGGRYPSMPDGRDGLIERLYPSSIPSMECQAISLRIAAALLEHVESEDLGRVLQASSGIALSRKVIRPDIMFVARERRGIIGKSGLHAAPDLIVEVLSAARREKHLRAMKHLYTALEVKEYWIVHPDNNTVEVLVWSELGYISAGIYSKNDILYSPLLPRFRLPLSNVFRIEDE